MLGTRFSPAPTTKAMRLSPFLPPPQACRSSLYDSITQEALTLAKRPRQTVFEAVTPPKGFLPTADPVHRLPDNLKAYEDALDEIPKLLLGRPGLVRKELQSLPPFAIHELSIMSRLSDQQQQMLLATPPPAGSCYTRRQKSAPSSDIACDPELWRAYMVLSFLSHAYMWCDGPDVPQTLPAVLAKPWVQVSAAIGMPPVLVYATYNLMNWRRLDVNKPIELGNMACLHNFFGGLDEEWFRLVHIAIEAAAAPAIAALQPLQQAAKQADPAAMELHLVTVIDGLQTMQQLLSRVGEKCDPYIYYKRVRVPMSGWKNNPALPNGLIYEGLWDSQPQQLYGETGAQSAIVPALDIVLGVKHKKGWLQQYLTDMRQHMPPSHRAFLAQLEAGPSVRDTVLQLTQRCSSDASPPSNSNSEGSSNRGSLFEAYNAAVNELEKFRAQHRAFANTYIAQWSKKEVGTGGSDFMPALAGYREATAAHKLSGGPIGCPLH